MSHTRIKTTYKDEEFGNTVEYTLYAHHNHTANVVAFYDEQGHYLFGYAEDGLIEAINRLSNPDSIGVEPWTEEDIEKINNRR